MVGIANKILPGLEWTHVKPEQLRWSSTFANKQTAPDKVPKPKQRRAIMHFSSVAGECSRSCLLWETKIWCTISLSHFICAQCGRLQLMLLIIFPCFHQSHCDMADLLTSAGKARDTSATLSTLGTCNLGDIIPLGFSHLWAECIASCKAPGLGHCLLLCRQNTST